MLFGKRYPYSDLHDLNLDWIVEQLKEQREDLDQFITYNSLKYADPLQWSITTQYEKNTIVLTSDGNAYLSVQPVPAGIAITNTEYWTAIGNFSASIEEERTARIEADAAINSRIDALEGSDLEFLNVKEYGAAGDGVTDDSDAIQSALNDGSEHVVFFPSGVYRITRTITFPSYVTIKGSGMTNTIIKNEAETDALVSENFYTSTSTDTVNDPCHSVSIEDITIDGGFYSDVTTATKSGKSNGRGLCFYGTKLQLLNARIYNCPQTNIWLEFSSRWAVHQDKGTWSESLLFNVISSFSGENGIYSSKFYDYSMIKCSVHTNGQKNTTASEDYSNIHMESGSMKMTGCHLSSLYGLSKPHYSLRIDSAASSNLISDSHIEGAYIPLALRSSYNQISNSYIYGSFGDTDIIIAGTHNRVQASCAGQVADGTHTYPTWTGAVSYESGASNNNLEINLINTPFTSDLTNMGARNDTVLIGFGSSSTAIMPASMLTRANMSRSNWDIRVTGFGEPTRLKIFDNAYTMFNNSVPMFGTEPQDMTGDIFTQGRGLYIIQSRTGGTLYLNGINLPGQEVTVVNLSSSAIPVNGTGGIYVDGVTYPTASSLSIPANSVMKFIAVDASHYKSF